MFGRILRAVGNSLSYTPPRADSPAVVARRSRQEDYAREAERASEPKKPKEVPYVSSSNCPDCGGMGRTGGDHSYDTIGGSCTTCRGTGSV
jgi:hypothetical protein